MTVHTARRPIGRSALLPVTLVAIGAMGCSSNETEAESAAEPVRPAPAADPATEEPPARGEATAETEDPAEEPDGREWTFEDTDPGQLPESWSAPVGEWRVETVDQAPSGSRVVAQRATNRSPVFNVALVDGSSHGDVDLTVRVRAREGRIDQGGGVVWRARDAESYYIARYNPLEDNYRVYTVREGRRRQLASADVRLEHQAWHTLRVRMVGDHIECFLDEQRHLDVHDDTFGEAGMVGLWTKADAQTQFDDLVVRGLDP